MKFTDLSALGIEVLMSFDQKTLSTIYDFNYKNNHYRYTVMEYRLMECDNVALLEKHICKLAIENLGLIGKEKMSC